MKLGEKVLKVLNKLYEPSRLVEAKVGRYDLAFKTDESGRPVLLFIGHKDQDGKIIGERFARRIITDKEGKITKDHWDNKGRSLN